MIAVPIEGPIGKGSIVARRRRPSLFGEVLYLTRTSRRRNGCFEQDWTATVAWQYGSRRFTTTTVLLGDLQLAEPSTTAFPAAAAPQQSTALWRESHTTEPRL